jgi:hypothetical protein
MPAGRRSQKVQPMNINDLILVSVDDHVVEPPNVFDDRLPAKYVEFAGGVSGQDVDKVTHRNAMRHFHYGPLTALGGKENCTVGPLRTAVAGHDVWLKSQRREGENRFNSANAASELAKMASSATE